MSDLWEYVHSKIQWRRLTIELMKTSRALQAVSASCAVYSRFCIRSVIGSTHWAETSASTASGTRKAKAIYTKAIAAGPMLPKYLAGA